MVSGPGGPGGGGLVVERAALVVATAASKATEIARLEEFVTRFGAHALDASGVGSVTGWEHESMRKVTVCRGGGASRQGC